MNARESDSYGSYIDWRPLRRPPSRDIHLMGSTSKPQIRGHTCVRAHYEFQLRVRQQAFTINHLKRYMWNQCKALQSIKCPEHENWRTFWYMGDPQRARASCFSFWLRFGFCFGFLVWKPFWSMWNSVVMWSTDLLANGKIVICRVAGLCCRLALPSLWNFPKCILHFWRVLAGTSGSRDMTNDKQHTCPYRQNTDTPIQSCRYRYPAVFRDRDISRQLWNALERIGASRQQLEKG